MTDTFDYTFRDFNPDDIENSFKNFDLDKMDISLIEEELKRLDIEEAALRAQLDKMVDGNQGIANKHFQEVKLFLPDIINIKESSDKLNNELKKSSDMLNTVSEKISLLDKVKGRVFSCMKRVDDIIDLRSCSDVVNTSLEEGDYERAAAHIHRYLALDESLIRETVSEFSEAENIDISFKHIREAAVKLKDIAREKFTLAVEMNDENSVQRFFKIFPFLFLHDEGLQKYSLFLRSKLSQLVQHQLTEAVSSFSSHLPGKLKIVFSQPFISLIMEIQDIILQLKDNVNLIYGPGHILYILIEIHKESDIQTKKIVLELKKSRCIDEKIKIIRDMKFDNPSIKSLDVKEIDLILTEITSITSHAEAYLKFMDDHISTSLKDLREHKDITAEFVDEVTKIIISSETKLQIQELISMYISFENHFMRESITRALQLNPSQEKDSLVDDTFYILRKCLRRALSTGSADGIGALLNDAGSILLDFKITLQSNCKGIISTDITGLLQGKLNTKLNDPLVIVSYCHALNNIETALEYVKRLSQELETEFEKITKSSTETNVMRLQSCLDEFSSHNKIFKALLNTTIDDFYKLFMHSKLAVKIEAFSARNFEITQEEINESSHSTQIQQLMIYIQESLNSFEKELSQSIFDSLLNFVIDDICLKFELMITKCKFNHLGSLLLDREFRMVTHYLTSKTSMSIRDRLSRMNQTLNVLSLESLSEIKDLLRPQFSSSSNKFNHSEIRKLLLLRTDLNKQKIIQAIPYK